MKDITLTYNQAVSILKNTNTIRLKGYEWLTLARQLSDTNPIVSSEWLNYKRNWTQYNPAPDLKKESTYDNCVDCELNVCDNTIFMIITVWDGDLLDGHKVDERCKFVLSLAEIPHRLTTVIVNRFYNDTIREIINEDNKQFEQRVFEKMTSKLNGINC
ncbi:MAG: hypothetical protein ACXW2E_01535 [Nitrososphaeraceae archaeon]